MYVGDADNRVIRKIDTLGNVTTFAGSGFSGNTDGLVSTATFATITKGYIDKDDKLYINTGSNSSNTIRLINPALSILPQWNPLLSLVGPPNTAYTGNSALWANSPPSTTSAAIDRLTSWLLGALNSGNTVP